MNSFKQRLIEYRETLGIATKRQMAERIKISEQLYAMLESGYREPSKKTLASLVELSGMPAEYWLYGVINNNPVEKREELKDTKEAIHLLVNLEIIKDVDIPKEAMDVLNAALRSDIKHILLKNKQD